MKRDLLAHELNIHDYQGLVVLNSKSVGSSFCCAIRERKFWLYVKQLL